MRPQSLSGRLALMLGVALLVAFALMSAAFVRDRHLRAGEREATQAADRIVLALSFVASGQVSLPVEAAGLRVQRDDTESGADDATRGAPMFGALLQARLRDGELIEARAGPSYMARVRLPGGARVRVTVVHEPPPHALPPPPFLAFAGLAGAIAAAVIVATLWITRPLRRVAQAANAIDTRQHSQRLDESGPSEVAAVLRAFNRMLDRIEQQTTQRVRVLRGVSHDLKTPLTRLRFRVDGLADSAMRESIARDIDAMESMVGGALDYMRTLEDAQPMARVDLVALLQAVCDDANQAMALGPTDRSGPHSSATAHRLRNEPATLQRCTPVHITARPLALRRAFANLVDNAIRYGGTADVTIEAGSTDVIVRVRDAGPGMSERDLTRAFEPYYRGSAAADTAPGTGLGLAIVRDTLARHGGGVELRNLAGNGLEASVRLATASDAGRATGAARRPVAT